jgi:hypothetical protein
VFTFRSVDLIRSQKESDKDYARAMGEDQCVKSTIEMSVMMGLPTSMIYRRETQVILERRSYYWCYVRVLLPVTDFSDSDVPTDDVLCS